MYLTSRRGLIALPLLLLCLSTLLGATAARAATDAHPRAPIPAHAPRATGGRPLADWHPSNVHPAPNPPASDPVRDTVVVTGRWAGYLGLALLAGSWLFAPRRHRVARLGLSLLALGAAAELYPFDAVVLGSRYGWLHLLRLGICVPLAALPASRGSGRRPVLLHLGRLTLGALVIGTFVLAGHPSTSALPSAGVLVAALHLAAAGLWIGAVLMILGEPEIAPRWSRIAGWTVAVLALSGLVQATLQVGTPAHLFDTTYGRLLLAKGALLALALGLAAFARRTLLTDFDQERGRRRLVLLVAVESVLLVSVLVVTAALSQSVPGRELGV